MQCLFRSGTNTVRAEAFLQTCVELMLSEHPEVADKSKHLLSMKNAIQLRIVDDSKWDLMEQESNAIFDVR